MFIVIRVLESVVMVNLENPPVSGLRSQEGKKKRPGQFPHILLQGVFQGKRKFN